MPRLNPTLKTCVFLLYGTHPTTGTSDVPLGTGVLVGLPPTDRDPVSQSIRHIYAITCRHVAPNGASIIRLNTKQGKSRLIELEPHEWDFIPSGDDVAAVDITDSISESDEISAVPVFLFATREFVQHKYLGIGEDGFMLGLFAEHSGAERNLIAGRFGNISMLADDNAPIEQPHGIKRPAHIFDMRSRGGFSGSPVFVYRTPAGDLRDISNGPRLPSPLSTGFGNVAGLSAEWMEYWDAHDNTFLKFFGIHVAQYRESVEARKANAEINDVIRNGDKLSLPGGMTVVAPAWAILDLLDLPTFVSRRITREHGDRKTSDDVQNSESA